LFGLVH